MAKLSDFKKSQPKTQQKATERDVMDKFNEYKNMSKPQLEQSLFSEVARQKQTGAFDYEQLAGMVENLKTALPPQDYNNIKRLLESLK